MGMKLEEYMAEVIPRRGIHPSQCIILEVMTYNPGALIKVHLCDHKITGTVEIFASKDDTIFLGSAATPAIERSAW